MTKKIRFPLDMGNGIEVRTLEELQENFSIEKVLGYYADGKLVTWLRDRYLDDIADTISELNKNDSDFTMRICNVFGVEYDDKVDMVALEERNRKLSLLKQYTDKKDYFDVVDDIAFNQDELYDLLDEDKHTIYLCGDKFSIPLAKQDMKYIGINNPVVLINSKEILDFTEKNIEFIDVKFDDAYQVLVNSSKANYSSDAIAHTDLIDDFNNLKGDNLVRRIENEIKQETVLADKARYMIYQIYQYKPSEIKNITLNVEEEIKKAAENGYEAARIRCSLNFNMYNGEYTDKTNSNVDKEAYRKYICRNENLRKIDMEDCFVLYEIGVAHLCFNGLKAIEYIRKSADMGCWLAERSMGKRYQQGTGVTYNVSLANEWFRKSADKGIAEDCWQIAWNCLYNLHNEEETAYKYIDLAYEDKEFVQQQYRYYQSKITSCQSYNYSYYLNTYISSAGYGSKSELKPKINKAFSTFFSNIDKVFDANNDNFKSFCNNYINAFVFCLNTKKMLDYGDKKIDRVCVDNALTYTDDIRNLLSNLLNEYRVSYSLYDLSEEDYGWHEEAGVTTSADGFFERFLTPTNYTANADKGGRRIGNEVQSQLARYNDKAHGVMKDYFIQELS